jgi:outer membrane protein assembly factor BamB
LGFSSPVIWEDKLFLTTAISGMEDPELKVGLYGSIEPVNDSTSHTWKVYCLDKNSGDILWEKTSVEGIPKQRRHPKSSHANCTIATNGEYVVAFFASEGLYCYDMDGNLIWTKDFGVLESSFFLVPEAAWGFASSPVIYEDVVVVLCDVMKNSFLATLDVKTGKEIWRVKREDLPTWGTPTIYKKDNITQVIVNGYHHTGGYDFYTGKEIWKIDGAGDIPVPTPVVADDIIYLNSAHGPRAPIYAVRTNTKGDISLKDGEDSNDFIVWSIDRGGAYMQTPLIYEGYLYNLKGNGSLSCFDAKSGELIYKEKVGNMDSFSASGVAADGKLYFAGEQGNVFVVAAGPEFQLLSTNDMKGICMATPALSEGVLFIRTENELVAVQEK